MNIRLFLTLTLFGVASLLGNSQRDTVDLYIFAGESNGLAGYVGTLNGDTYPADSSHYLGVKNDVMMFNALWDTAYYETIFGTIPRWKPLYAGENTGGLNAAKYYFGQEVSMSYYLPKPVYIIKNEFNPADITAYSLLANWDKTERVLRRAFQQARINKKVLNLKAFILNIGGSDGAVEAYANAFRTRLADLFDNFNKSYYTLCVKYSMPNNIKTYEKVLAQTKLIVSTYQATVEAAKVDFVADSLNSVYFPDDYDIRGDMHYTTSQFLRYGIDLYYYFEYGILTPKRPSALTASQVGSDIKINWSDDSSGEDGFIIKRKTTGDYSTIGTVTANEETFTDSDVTAGIDYTYKVLAYNDNIKSQESEEVTKHLATISELLDDGNTEGWFISDSTSTLTKDGGTGVVSEWRDYLGVGLKLSTTIGNPIWTSGGGIAFTDDRMKTANSFGSSSDPESVYMVVKFQENGNIFPANFVGLAVGAGTFPDIGLYSDGTHTLTYSTTTWYVARIKCTETSGKFGLGSSTVTPTITRLAETFIELGGRAGAGTYSDIIVKEIIIRKVDDDSVTENGIYDYLKAKYGL